jgi:hypothetical protein
LLTVIHHNLAGKGRTYAEMDILFEQKVSARKFRKAVVDPFAIPEPMTEIVNTKKE